MYREQDHFINTVVLHKMSSRQNFDILTEGLRTCKNELDVVVNGDSQTKNVHRIHLMKKIKIKIKIRRTLLERKTRIFLVNLFFVFFKNIKQKICGSKIP